MKKSRSEISKERQKSRLSFTELLFKRIARLQNSLFNLLDDVVNNLDTDDGGRIKFTTGNISKTETGLRVKVQRFQSQSKLLDWLTKRMLRLIKLNRDYFSTLDPDKKESVDEKAARLVMRRWGYDLKSGKLIKGGYLESLQTDSGIAKDISSQIYRAIQAKTPLKQFRKEFKQQFTGGKDSLGMLERYYYQRTFDLFQQVDRQVGNVYADELGLNYARYAGTKKNNTRPFCQERIGKVFTRQEIEEWKDLNFKGKPVGYVPAVDLGGYNCRHSLDWISYELAVRWRPDLKKDEQ